MSKYVITRKGWSGLPSTTTYPSRPLITYLPEGFRLQVRRLLAKFKVYTYWCIPTCDGVTLEVEWPAWPSTNCAELPKYEIAFCDKRWISQCLQPVVLEKMHHYRQCCPACMRQERKRVEDKHSKQVIVQIKPIDDRFDALK